jgi:hypothetical protein
MPIGLALGSGAARGLAHVGVPQSLVEAGLRPAAMADSSIGALVAGLYARSLDPTRVGDEVLAAVRNPVFRRICGEYRGGVRRAGRASSLRRRVGDLRRSLLRAVVITRRSMVSPAQYAALIRAFMPDDYLFEQARIRWVPGAARRQPSGPTRTRS